MLSINPKYKYRELPKVEALIKNGIIFLSNSTSCKCSNNVMKSDNYTSR